MAYLTDDLVTAVRRRAQLPDADGKLDDTDILDIANEELQTFILPWLIEARSHYYIKEIDIEIQNGQSTYLIPDQVTAGTLFDVSIVNSNGESMGSIPMLPLEDSTSYGASGSWGYPSSLCFALQGNEIVLLPTPTQDGPYTLRVRFARRPNRLVPSSECMLAISFQNDTPTTGRTQFSLLNGVPSSFGDFAQKIDLVQAVPNFEVWASYVTPANVTVSSFDVDSEVVPTLYRQASLQGEDDGYPWQFAYWCLAQETCVVPVPDFMQPVLVSITASQCLRSIGDFEGAEMEMQQLGRKMGQLKTTLEPRVEGARPRIMSFSHPMRATWNRGWWWY